MVINQSTEEFNSSISRNMPKKSFNLSNFSIANELLGVNPLKRRKRVPKTRKRKLDQRETEFKKHMYQINWSSEEEGPRERAGCSDRLKTSGRDYFSHKTSNPLERSRRSSGSCLVYVCVPHIENYPLR